MAINLTNKVKRFSEIPLNQPSFLVSPFIPANALIILAGASGCGKSSFISALAAMLSLGKGLYGNAQPPARILIFSAEDNYDGSIKCRLDCAEADEDNIFAIPYEDCSTYPFDIFVEALEDTIKANKINLVILDPITSFLGNININKSHEVRKCLITLQKLAKQTSCAILGIAHYNKSQKTTILSNKILGSSEFFNVPRSVVLISYHPYEQSRRVLINIKNSFIDSDTMLSYKLHHGLIKDVTSETIPQSVLLDAQNPKKQSKLTKAINWLSDILQNGPVNVTDIKQMCETQDFSYSYVQQTAKVALGVASRWGQDGKKHEWYLPDQDNANDNNE